MRVDTGIVLAILLIFAIVAPSTAIATTCKCKQHNAEAEASGTCSRTEDKNNCTLSFTSTTPEEYANFVARLSNLGIDFDPRKALSIAFREKPEVYQEQLFKLLPALFAVSQRTRFQDATPVMLEAIKDAESMGYSDKIRDIFAREGEAVENISNGQYYWTVSYGCATVKVGDNIEFMVKTRYSRRLFFCDGKPGE